MRNVLIALVMMAAALLVTGFAMAEEREIIAHTEVTKWGQMPIFFEIAGQSLPQGVAAADFTITGEATGWGASATHPFECGVQKVEATEKGWRLYPEQFPDKYFYVKSFTAACEGHPEAGFSMEEITRTETPVADDFETMEDPATKALLHVFTPNTEEKAPVVIVFHGYGDTENLLTYRTAVTWAEEENQKLHPCTVIAPSIPSNVYVSDFVRSKVFEAVLNLVDQGIQEGRIDPKRIYVMGNSFGGMSSLEMAEQYPDRVSAVLALCPALNYSPKGNARLSEIVDIPVYIAQAEQDETIPSSVGIAAAQTMRDAGNQQVQIKIYSDEEMNAAGAVHGSEQTYSFHHVELAVMEDPAYSEWLFAQHK